MATPVSHSATGSDEWKILAEEAAQEKDPEKLMEIVRALNDALDEEARRKIPA